MWEAPFSITSAVPFVLRPPLVYYDEVPRNGWLEDIYEEMAESARIEHLKSITKEETVQERAQKEKRARKNKLLHDADAKVLLEGDSSCVEGEEEAGAGGRALPAKFGV